MYINGKMKPVDIVPGMGEYSVKGEWWRGMNSSMIYFNVL
jgi:hypothetical protein